MKNKIELFSIALFSVLLTSFGAYIDGDKNNLSILENMKEFILMSILVFITISAIYYSAKFLFKKTKSLFV